jgi:quercetin dioxygenase-like cupin family protein
MGRIAAVFKADEKESSNSYSVSEWWLDAKTKGPGTHSHEEDDVFLVIEGTMSFLISSDWIDAPEGSFVLVLGGTPHNFENRSSARAGVLNFKAKSGFESDMPAIRAWFKEHPPANTDASA